jgi:hypothetical protein
MADEFIVRLAQRRDAADGTPLDDESPLAPVVPERRSAMSPWELLERWHREDGLLDDLEEETLARPSFSLSRWHHAPHGAPVFPLEWTAEAWRRFDPIRVAHRARAPDPDVFRAPRPAAFPDPASWDTTRAVAVGAVVVALRRRVLSLSTAPELLDDVLANDRWFRRHRADPAEATGAALLFAAFERAADRLLTETPARASAASRAESAAERARTATRTRHDAIIDWGVATAAVRAVGRARTMARALARIAAQPPAEPLGDPATAAAARVAARSARDAALALGARLDEMAAAGGAIRRQGGARGEEGGRGGRRNGRAPEAAARHAQVASSATSKRRVVATPGATPGAKAASLALAWASPPRRRALGDATNRMAVFSPGSPVVLSPRRAGAFAGGDRAGR